MRLTIGRKLGLGFFSIIALIGMMTAFTLYSNGQVSSSVDDATLASNRKAIMIEKIGDHLDWVNALQKSFLENEDTINVQMDPTKCGLGKWLHGDDAAALTADDPQAALIIEALHPPHNQLHASAHAIEDVWTPVHPGLISRLHEIRDGHRLWVESVAEAIISGEECGATADPEACVLGKWLDSEEYARWAADFPEMRRFMDGMHEKHEELHHSVIPINEAIAAGNLDEAKRVFNEVTRPAVSAVAGAIESVIELEQTAVARQEEAMRIFEQQTLPALTLTRAGLEDLRDHLQTVAEEGQTAAQGALSESRVVGLAISLIAVGLAFFASVVITRMIVGPLKALMARFERIKDKDMTTRIDARRKDEIGELSRGFNDLVETLQGVLLEVRVASEQVSGASTEIAASSEQIARGISEQTTQTEQLSTATEEMSRSVGEVAEKGNEASGVAREAGSQAEAGGSTVEQTVSGMDEIARVVERAAATVRELGSRAEDIGGVVEVINDIADQTNLLALNAAIEAARAGEHGRGFAVVADEVRKLADRTMKATEEISSSIEQIQTGTADAVEQMDTGGETVQKGVGFANEAGDALRTIVGGSQTVLQTIEQIASATEEQAAAAGEISQSIDSIRAVSEESSEGVRQAAEAAGELAKKSEELQQMIAVFKL